MWEPRPVCVKLDKYIDKVFSLWEKALLFFFVLPDMVNKWKSELKNYFRGWPRLGPQKSVHPVLTSRGTEPNHFGVKTSSIHHRFVATLLWLHDRCRCIHAYIHFFTIYHVFRCRLPFWGAQTVLNFNFRTSRLCRDTGRERRGNKRDLARPIKIVINSLCAENLINRADNLSVTVFCLASLFVSV